MINEERFAHIWERQKGRKIWLWVVACAAVYAILFVVSGSWQIFLIANPIMPVQVGDCIIQSRTVCPGANLGKAQLIRASLHKADLRDANLRGANLWNADLEGANLAEADLTEADLRGANLRGVNLTGVKMQRVKYDIGTLWPGDTHLKTRVELLEKK